MCRYKVKLIKLYINKVVTNKMLLHRLRNADDVLTLRKADVKDLVKELLLRVKKEIIFGAGDWGGSLVRAGWEVKEKEGFYA